MAKKPSMQPANDGFATVHTVRIPLWPYLVAPLFCLVALPATWGVHRAYATSARSAGYTGLALGLFGVGILIMVFFLSRPRGVVMTAMATLNTVLALLWCTPAILSGPFNKTMLGLWLAGTLFVSIDCGLYRIMRQTRGDDGSRGQILNGEFAELGDAVRQLKGVRFGKPVVDGARVTAAIEMPPGRSFEEVAAARKEVASLLDVPATAVRTPGHMDSERRGSVSVVPRDQLRDPIPDPGLEPGLSMADPIVLGVAEDGTPAQVILPGDPATHRNAVGVMGLVGMTGSGKTELLLRFCKCVATRVDGDLFVIDTRKEGQLPTWLKRAAKRVVSDRDEALDWLEDLEARVADRAVALGRAGHKQWVKGCGISFETYVIFEAAGIAKDSNLVDLAETVRSVGMAIVLEFQRATYDRLPTSARSNITTWICLGVQREDDAEAAISEATALAGAAPWKWKNGKPGYFYLEWAGRAEELWAAPCRSFIQDDEERGRDVAEVLGWNDEGPPAAPVEPYRPPRGGPEPDGEQSEPGGEGDPEVSPGVDPDDPPDDVDPSEPIVIPPGMPRIPFGDSRPKMLPADALGLLRSHIFDLRNAGAQHVQPSMLGDVLAQTGLSSSWLQNALKQLCAEGLLREPRPGERGVYRIVQRERAAAGAGVPA